MAKALLTDVAVVGAGLSGLAAMVAAAERGASVILFEKSSVTGGTGNMGMGPLAIESKIQRRRQIALTREEAFKIFMDYTHWRVDARLVKSYLDKSADTIDWLEKMGVEWFDVTAYFPGSNFTWHEVKLPTGGSAPGAAGNIAKALTDTGKKLGAQIFLQTKVRKLIKTGGKITGLLAEDRNGEAIQVTAKAVIISTGGFGDNPEMIKKYTGYDWGKDMFSFRIPGLIGEGIRMAWEVGAGEEGLNMEMIYGIPDLGSDGPLGGPPSMAIFRQPNLMVNLQGERFMNEEVMGNTTFTGNAVSRQKGRMAFNIYDEDTKDYYVNNGFDFLNAAFPDIKVTDFDADIKLVLDQGNKHVFVANSIEELAAKTGINAENLKKTVEEYNVACDTGRDNLMTKKAKYLRPVRKPRFFAGHHYPAGYGSLGGIKINHRTEVLTKDSEIIAGLYASGTDACSIYADSYVFVLPGNTMGFALNSGRIAGENASVYVKL